MESVDARIGNTSYITGKIEGEGNLVIEGRVEGTIMIKGDLQIEAGAQVKSSVFARNIYVMGLLVGDAVASERVELASTGRMIGDVRSPRFTLNEGAAFRGRVDMVDFPASERSLSERGVSDRSADAARSQRSGSTAYAASSRPATPVRSVAPSFPARRVEPRREPMPVRAGVSRPFPASVGSSSAPNGSGQASSNGGGLNNGSSLTGAAQNTAPAQGGYPSTAGAMGSSSASSTARGGSLYTPPPLPRPPEIAGARKAIIIKKKTDGS